MTKLPELPKNRELVTFESWSKMLEYCKQDLPDNAFARSSTGESSSRSEFSQVKNYNEALTLAVTGWNEGTEQIKAYSESLINKVLDKIEVPQIYYDVTGLDFDISLVNSGVPEHWYNFRSKIKEGNGDTVVSIVVNCSTSNGVSADTIIKRGAIIAAIVELLEYSGHKVQVIYDAPFSTGFDVSTINLEFRTTVKLPNQPLDLSRLAFAVAHPAMYRRLMFHALELNPSKHEQCGHSYGGVVELPETERGDVYFGMMRYNQTEWTEDPEGFIKRTLREQGVTIND